MPTISMKQWVDARLAQMYPERMTENRRDGGDWDESKHPRGEGGKFGEGGTHPAAKEANAASKKASSEGSAKSHRSAEVAHGKAQEAAKEAGDKQGVAFHGAKKEEHEFKAHDLKAAKTTSKFANEKTEEASKTGTAEAHQHAASAHDHAAEKAGVIGDVENKAHHEKQKAAHQKEAAPKMSEVAEKASEHARGTDNKETIGSVTGMDHANARSAHKEAAAAHRAVGNHLQAEGHEKKAKEHEAIARVRSAEPAYATPAWKASQKGQASKRRPKAE